MGMQTLMPDGKVLTEFFETEEKMSKRRRHLESQGGKVQRVVRVYTNPKYPTPHQGKKEIEKHRRRLEQQLAKQANR